MGKRKNAVLMPRGVDRARRLTWCACLLAIGLVMPGCYFASQYVGDGTIQTEPTSWIRYRIELPEISLSKTATYSFSIEGAPTGKAGLVLHGRDGDGDFLDQMNDPATKVDVTIVDDKGTVLLTRALESHRWGHSHSTNEPDRIEMSLFDFTLKTETSRKYAITFIIEGTKRRGRDIVATPELTYLIDPFFL